jgi:predicted nucleotidyltransferase
MKDVVSFRMEAQFVAEAREKAAAKGKKFTSYLEELVMNDISGKRADGESRSNALRVLRLLRSHRSNLEKVGIRHADIFGSVARGDERPDSDVDILVDLDPAVVDDLLKYSRVQRTLQDVIGMPVDIAERGRLREDMAEEIESDCINAF